MKQAKHRYNEKTKTKKFIPIFLVFVIVLISVAFIISSTYGNVEKPVENETTEEPIKEEEPEEVELPPEQFEIVDTSDLPEKYQGYPVLGKIVIDKLGVTQKILDTTEEAALKFGVTKFWGPDLNEPGNVCLSGHNYQKVFGKLKQLEVGDSFYIISKDGRKIDYTITETLGLVNPYDMDHIKQNDDGVRKVTLITCEPRRSYKVYSKGRTY